MVAHISNPSTQDSEEGGSMSSKPAWSTYGVLSQPEHTHTPLYTKTLSQKRGRKSGGGGEKEDDEGRKEITVFK